MPGDMIVEPVVYCPVAFHDSGVGISEDVDIVRTDPANPVVSRHFNIQIRDEDDIEKIKMPKVTRDDAKTQENYEAMVSIFELRWY